MNYFLVSLLNVFLIISTILSVPFKEIETAFSNAEASKIIELGANKILISIDGKEGIYSKSQGTQVLSEFFKTNPPQSFKFSVTGKAEGLTSFAVGNYQSKQNFRVSLKFRKNNDNHQIESLMISVVKN